MRNMKTARNGKPRTPHRGDANTAKRSGKALIVQSSDYPCDRPGCLKAAPPGELYCSDTCYDADNDPNPVTVVAPNKTGGFGNDLHWQDRTPVHLPDEEDA